MLETRLKMRAAGENFEDFTYYSTEMMHFGALPCTQILSPPQLCALKFCPPQMRKSSNSAKILIAYLLSTV